jgi:Cu/Ag efflux protein CusF
MFNKSFKTVALAMAVLFVVAPFALAGGQHSQQAQYRPTQPGEQSTTGPSTTTGQPSHTGTMGMQDEKAISATVEKVDQQDKRLSLRLEDGEAVELQVSETLLSTLQEGDSVEVSIRKAYIAQQPGTGNTQPSQPPSGSMTKPPSGQSN